MIRKLLAKHVMEARSMLEDLWGRASTEAREHEGEHEAIEEAVREADRTLPKSRVVEVPDEKERETELQELAKDAGKTEPKEQQEYVKRVKDLPFVVESLDFPGNM